MAGRYRRFYSTLPLKELRRRQTTNAEQTIYAYRLAQNSPDSRPRALKGLIRLQRIALLLADAVNRLE